MNNDYPYYNLIYKVNKKQIKEKVKEFKPNIITTKFLDAKQYKKKYFIIIDKWEDNYQLNSLTDYFSEKERIKCKFGRYLSPLEYYIKNKNKFKNKNVIDIREKLFLETKFCNNFRISVVLTILQSFNVKKYLDISAGWGDRLLASLLYDVELYCGVDPNKDLHKHYKEMINTFAKKKKKFILIEDGFETAKLPDTKFDLVFSSPPFFDLEKYSNYDKDSLTKFKTEKNWCDNFLMKSIFKAYKYLEKNGHMILYIHSSPYVDKRLLELNKIMKYKGIIYFYENKLRGMHVWQKLI
jgi:16S rRNA G966 N2-methylase RsmD